MTSSSTHITLKTLFEVKFYSSEISTERSVSFFLIKFQKFFIRELLVVRQSYIRKIWGDIFKKYKNLKNILKNEWYEPKTTPLWKLLQIKPRRNENNANRVPGVFQLLDIIDI